LVYRVLARWSFGSYQIEAEERAAEQFSAAALGCFVA
jgi:hypothetical protein